MQFNELNFDDKYGINKMCPSGGMVDAHDSNSCGRKIMSVRVRPRAHLKRSVRTDDDRHLYIDALGVDRYATILPERSERESRRRQAPPFESDLGHQGC